VLLILAPLLQVTVTIPDNLFLFSSVFFHFFIPPMFCRRHFGALCQKPQKLKGKTALEKGGAIHGT
jgi:hypothetical protein